MTRADERQAVVVVFAGPTIGASDIVDRFADGRLTVHVEPPAARGDVLRAAEAGADVIALVDGLYESVPSTWHKEILWAIEHGVQVYGASSMGAVRAAECSRFGMIGVGEIHAAFERGELDDDDVALAHGPAEYGYVPLSEAMVNVRATIRLAGDEIGLGDATAELLDRSAKRLFYPLRRWSTIEAAAEESGADPEEVARFSAWRADRGTVDRKRADAEQLLDRILADVTAGSPSRPGRFRTVITSHFERMRIEERSLGGDRAVGLWRQSILEELQVHPQAFQAVATEAIRRRYARFLGRQAGGHPEPAAVDAASDRLRRRLGLLTPGDFEAWLRAEGLQFDDYTDMVEREFFFHLGETLLPPLATEDLLDVARLEGLTADLGGRAARKARLLREAGVEEGGHTPGGMSEDHALQWFCETRLGASVPATPEALEALAGRLGFSDSDALRTAVLRERRALDLGLE